jgi:large subunit ribosomal protein L29
MPILRIRDIRAMSFEERREKLVEIQTELARLETMVKAGGSIDNPSRIRELRKTIARILTIETEQSRAKEKEE